MSLWDFKVKTSDVNNGCVGTVEAPTKAEADQEVRRVVAEQKPNLTILKVVIRPSIGVQNMNRLMRRHGIKRTI